MKHCAHSVISILSLVSVFSLAACGGKFSIENQSQSGLAIISEDPPPAGIVGNAYSGYPFNAIGGEPPYKWSEAGPLPQGMTFAAGVLSGTPVKAGTFPITLTVVDSASPAQSASVNVNLVMNNPSTPVITVATIPSSAHMDQGQTAGVTATVINDPSSSGVTWSLSGAGSLTNQTATGVVYNAPLIVASGGVTAELTATSVEDSRVSSAVNIKVEPSPAISLAPPPVAIIGNAYSGYSFSASGGMPPFIWSQTGALPPGMTFSGGALSGTPIKAGTYPITLNIFDSASPAQSASLSVDLVVNNPTTPVITVATSPSSAHMDQGQTVGVTATVSNDPSNSGVTWSLSGVGSLTNQMGASVVYNAPSAVATGVTAVLTATSVEDPRVASAVNMNVEPLPVISTTPPPVGIVSSGYAKYSFPVNGGVPPLTWTETGALPSGMSFAEGVLSGTPIKAGTYPITLKIVDSSSPAQSASLNVNLVVNNPATPVITVKTSPTSAHMDQGQTVGVAATVTNDPSSSGVTWSLSGPGSLTNQTATAVVYNAPATVETGGVAAVLTATSAEDSRVSSGVNLKVEPLPAISATPPPVGIVSSAYTSYSFPVNGGVQPLKWTETGALPPGMTFAAGALSGTPIKAGTYPISLKVVDSASPAQSASLDVSLVMNNPATPIITVKIFPDFVIMDQGQTLGVTATVINDPSNSGVSWSLSGSGTITNQTATTVTYNAPPAVTSGVVTALLTATSVEDPRATFKFTLQVQSSPAILTSLPDGAVGSEYNIGLPTAGCQWECWVVLTKGALPPGLEIIDTSIWGVPAGSAQTYRFTLKLTDNSEAGPLSASADLSIKVGPPLPLTLTAPSLPAGGSGIYYFDDSPTATGGVGPYTYSLTAGSAPLPPGLNLSTYDWIRGNPLILSGVPAEAGTTVFSITARDSQVPPATATASYSLTIDQSIEYVGTQAFGQTSSGQSPNGGIWQMEVLHQDEASGLLGYNGRGTGGSGTFSALNTGFESVPVDDYGRPKFSDGDVTPYYFVEIPGDVLVSIPLNATELADFPPPPYKTLGNVIAAAGNTCPQLSSATSYQFVSLTDITFDLTRDAFGVATLTQTGSNSYNLALNASRLDGSAGSSATYTGLTCDSKLQVFRFTNTAGKTSTAAISPNGVMVIDNGTGTPAIGLQQPAANLPTAAMIGAQYLGAVFYANSRTVDVGCRTIMGIYFCTHADAQSSDAVGFGPGSGDTMSGGVYKDIGSDGFSAHGNNYTITLGTQTSPGLFPGGTLSIGANTLQNFDVVAGQVNGKYVLFGVTADPAASPLQPYAVLLVQQ